MRRKLKKAAKWLQRMLAAEQMGERTLEECHNAIADYAYQHDTTSPNRISPHQAARFVLLAERDWYGR